MPKILSPAQIEQFVEIGYTKLDEAFPRTSAMAAQDFLWGKIAERNKVARDDRSTWPPFAGINENYTEPAFRACETSRLHDAVVDLLGEDRWDERGAGDGWGWWPINFPNRSKPWTVPAEGWHWDGSDRKHFVHSPDQGLLVLCLFSETAMRGGGTLVVEGSHRVIARYLNEQPEGVELLPAIKDCQESHPFLRELTTPQPETLAEQRVQRFMDDGFVDDDGMRLCVAQVTGAPGDVYLGHPFLFHTSSQNHADVPRFMCNRKTPLKERMRFDRADGSHSPLERSIRDALSTSVAMSK